MGKENKNYGYLIDLYTSVDEHLSNKIIKEDKIAEIVVNFCTVIERIIKIQLYKKNPILIYKDTQFKDNNSLIAIILKKNTDMPTIDINEALNRFGLLFNKFSEDEDTVIRNIYKNRNCLIHSIEPDNDIISKKEDIIKKMGTVWGKISKQMINVFGKDLIKSKKPKKTYSESELEKILEEEVKKKIQRNGLYDMTGRSLHGPDYSLYNYSNNLNYEKCPRCGNFSFSLDDGNIYNNFIRGIDRIMLSSHGGSNLYKCSECNLELTRKEYEISKKIRSNLST